MSTLKVRNWQRFQHYKDRNPPWIKLHYELLTSPDWVMLADASKLLAIVCMMVASRNDGCVPNNPEYIKKVGQLDVLPDFKPLIECGFLEQSNSNASAMLADASTKTEAYSKEVEKKDLSMEKPVFEKYPLTNEGWEQYQKDMAEYQKQESLKEPNRQLQASIQEAAQRKPDIADEEAKRYGLGSRRARR